MDSNDTKRLFAILWISLMCFTIVADSVVGSDPPKALTTSGEVIGAWESFSSDFLKLNREIAAYHGIPYAEPPVGDLRFRRPVVPVVPWEGAYEATEIPPACPQLAPSYLKHLDAAETKTENCLFLNVFVPSHAPENASVMVYIHGGGLNWGNGLNYPADPLPLAAFGDVILVTLNYRLGAFGFLSTGDDIVPPNIGLHDQRAALKWVHENAKAFGGDPNSVTVFGNEAGAVSVGWHLLSAESRQYFQRVILQSGSPFDDTIGPVSPGKALERTNLTAGLLGCSFRERMTKEQLRQCLLDTHAPDLVSVSSQVADILAETNPWRPVTDDDFITKSVPELIESGGFEDIDVMIGANKNEGTFRIYEATGTPPDAPYIDKDLFRELSEEFSLSDSARDIMSVLYQKENGEDNNYYDILSGIVTDTRHLCHITKFASSLTAAGCKVYLYELTHDPETESVMKFSWAGAGLMEELKYVFGLPFQTDLPFPIPEVERVVSAHFMRLWTNFAKTGDPNNSGNSRQAASKLPSWPEYSLQRGEYKEMNPHLGNSRNMQGRECHVWNHVIPRINDELAELEDLKSKDGRSETVQPRENTGGPLKDEL